MLALLALFNFFQARSCLYPPTIFCSVWAMLLIGLTISGTTFYPLSFLALTIYFIGAVSFVCGGITAQILATHKESELTDRFSQNDKSFVNHVLNWVLLAQVVIAPLYWQKLKSVSSLSGVDNLLIGLRIQTSAPDAGERVGLGIFAYLVAMMTFLTLIAVYEADSTPFKRYRACLYATIALGYQMITAARTGAVLLLISLTIISIIKAGKIKWKFATIGVFVFLLVFSIPAVLLNKGGGLELTVGENISSIAVSLRDYTLPSLVAFDRTITSPNQPSGMISFRSIFSIANAFGARINLPPDVLEYTLTPIPTNVYTLYYHYYSDFRLTGTMIVLFVLGMISTFLYLNAMTGNPRGVILYGIMAACLILSGFTEHFLTSASYWIQAILIVSTIYSKTLNRIFCPHEQ